MKNISIAEQFDKYFTIKIADTDALKEESYSIRHQVYCEELHWLPETGTKLETDECDPYSVTVLLEHRRTKKFAGTARLVIPPAITPELKLPFEQHCHQSINKEVLDPSKLPRGAFGEISRLAVPAQFRRRLDEQQKPFVLNDIGNSDIFSEDERRNFPNIALGLYLSLIALEYMCNHSHMFIVVEPRLKRRLERLGLHFIQCGNEMEYHGTRALFYLPRDKFISNLGSEMRLLYDLLENTLKQQLYLYPYMNFA